MAGGRGGAAGVVGGEVLVLEEKGEWTDGVEGRNGRGGGVKNVLGDGGGKKWAQLGGRRIEMEGKVEQEVRLVKGGMMEVNKKQDG